MRGDCVNSIVFNTSRNKMTFKRFDKEIIFGFACVCLQL